MRERNLYRDIRLADKIAAVDSASFDLGSTRVVLDGREIDDLTRAVPDPFEEQSAFFRTHANNPLPAEQRRLLRLGLIRLVSSPAAQRLIEEIRFAPGRFHTQGWGVTAVFDLLLPIICGARSQQLIDLSREYVDRVVISANVRGRRAARMAELSSSIWRRMQPYFELQQEPVPQDLVDLALSVDVTKSETPEVYSRLLLSMVGFTGIALEWALVMGMEKFRNDERYVDAFSALSIVMECQRIAPTAWKLVRRYRATNGHGVRDIVMMTASVQRSPQYWNDPLVFNPGRWFGDPVDAVSYFPFGKHRMLCPSRQFALDVLVHSLESVTENYDVRLGRPHGRPRAHILLAPPKRRFVLSEKSADAAE